MLRTNGLEPASLPAVCDGPNFSGCPRLFFYLGPFPDECLGVVPGDKLDADPGSGGLRSSARLSNPAAHRRNGARPATNGDVDDDG